jgi:putative phosphoribosyl transferase
VIVFADRREAGRLLAARLADLVGKDVVVLAIPRGGVVVGREIADAIGAPLDLIITRKLGAPGNPELAVGAVTQDGEVIVDAETAAMTGASADFVKKEAAKVSEEIARRLGSYRGERPLPLLEGKTVVIVDDGVATGSTVKAAIQSVRRRGAGSVVVAVPVGPRETVSELSRLADRVVCLSTPEPFFAIGQFYRDFEQVDDETVRKALVP